MLGVTVCKYYRTTYIFNIMLWIPNNYIRSYHTKSANRINLSNTTVSIKKSKRAYKAA